jgi:hypothetical protein
MPAVRRALAVLPVAAVAMAASPAQAAQVKTLPCVPFVSGQATMPIVATGFTPGGSTTISTNTAANPTPQILASGRLDGLGAFAAATRPPSFTRVNDNLETFNLIAEDRSNPAAPIVAAVPFQVVRFGMSRNPSPKRPRQAVTYTARGFMPGRPVYAHFRYGGRKDPTPRTWARVPTRRTVSLGVAEGPCGITTKRMRALPTKVRYGFWRAYIDQSKRFSVKTRPQWIDPFKITRVLR